MEDVRQDCMAGEYFPCRNASKDVQIRTMQRHL